jgi:UDP-N-acetylmuramoyl-tripeptide--D-alanyl-D-alanine ligase
MKFTARDVLNWLQVGELYGVGNETFTGVGTDTRNLPAGCLFVPIRGENFDGHAFVDQALRDGAAGVLFEDHDRLISPSFRVPDSRRALGEIARGWRNRFDLPLTAITGSNGKTTVKEMVAAIMAAAVGEPARLATRGNFNNDIGVPLTLFRLEDAHRMAVLELGMNRPGEIRWLTWIARPTIAVVNNAQREHQEFLDGVEATARENGSVFDGLPVDGTAVFPGDDACSEIWHALAAGRKTVRFGYADGPGSLDVWASRDAQPGGFTLHAASSLSGETTGVDVALTIDGAHNVRNALAAASVCLAAGISLTHVKQGLELFQPVTGRMQRSVSSGGVDLIDDTYNANPDSVLAAIDVLSSKASPRILVLGDMAEVGDQGPAFHEEVGRYARQRELQAVFAFVPRNRACIWQGCGSLR